MKFLTFEINGRNRLGAVEDDKIIDLNMAYSAYLSEKEGKGNAEEIADRELPGKIIEFIVKGEEALLAAKKALDFAKEKGFDLMGSIFSIEKVKFKAPIPRPSKIVCTGTNYEDYRKIICIPFSKVPLIFLKAPSCVIGHEEPIILPEGYGTVYHEWEFSCIISKRCRSVPKERVAEVIFGYTIFNDITGRALEALNREFQPWGKSIDTFGPMGPWIVTPDEMPPDLYNLRMIRRRNGVVESESNTSNMHFRLEDIIAFVTSFWTLEPGDVVTTASPPAGPIEPGDVIEAEIEGIGILRNPVMGEKVKAEYAELIGLEG